MTSSEARKSFLDYFASQDHQIVRSASLVPLDDPTLLFTNAGMNQFKDVFLGREQRSYTRATTSQKCMRVSGKHNDLNNVGPSWRHHTFFEMLGNFSFGDYFKQEAIQFAWTLLTDIWQLSPDRLYPTVFKGESGIPRDDEAHAIWSSFVPANRVVQLGLAENFWAMGDTGPCGRCSEVHYRRDETASKCFEPVCRGIDCNCDRYVEIWNNVFMEFNRDTEGNLSPLPAASIDTGMGLERVVAVLQGKVSNYDTDLFEPLLHAISERTGRSYGPHAPGAIPGPDDISMRVVADHLRAMTFLIADGVMPSNEWRGYVLRKIMRRAMRHGRKLGMINPFLHELTDVMVAEMGDVYPELPGSRVTIAQVVRTEEERFDAVLNDGLPKLESALSTAGSGGVLDGRQVFRLYDTYGLPLDFMEDLSDERAVTIDRLGFEKALELQRSQSRAKSHFKTTELPPFEMNNALGQDGPGGLPDDFVGYESTRVETQIKQIFLENGSQVNELDSGQAGYLTLKRTPFYLESGGQISDGGHISSEGGAEAIVNDIIRPVPSWPRLHRVEVNNGTLETEQLVTARVDVDSRNAIRRNHTATHLLHATLRAQLGNHVKQAGSLVAPDRLRFDFAHGSPITRNELDIIERKVNTHIYVNTPVETEVRTTQEAIDAGAMALFGEKYGESARVVSVPGVSVELCGGTHCRSTGEIGLFSITQETGVAAGVRRIEAVTGSRALAHAQAQRTALDEILGSLGVPRAQAVETVQRLQGETRRLARDLEQLKIRAELGPESDDVVEVGDARLIARRVSGLETDSLRDLADSLRNSLGRGVVVLASENKGKVTLVVSVSKELIDRVHAGKVVKAIAPIVGGNGGGRPDFAQAGGRQPSKIDALLSESLDLVSGMLAE